MTRSYTSIPFKTESGISSVNGVAKFSPAGVVLEFESKIFGLISGGVKEARIAMTDIHDVRFRKGLFKRGARIEIRLTSIAALSGLPNSDGRLKLKIDRADFEAARDAVLAFEKDMAGVADELPPAHTPVSVLFDESEEETRELKQ